MCNSNRHEGAPAKRRRSDMRLIVGAAVNSPCLRFLRAATHSHDSSVSSPFTVSTSLGRRNGLTSASLPFNISKHPISRGAVIKTSRKSLNSSFFMSVFSANIATLIMCLWCHDHLCTRANYFGSSCHGASQTTSRKLWINTIHQSSRAYSFFGIRGIIWRSKRHQ